MNHKLFYGTVLFLIILGLFSGMVTATTANFSITVDSYVGENTPSSNHGIEGQLFTASKTGGNLRSYLLINASSLSNSTIQSITNATLIIRIYNSGYSGVYESSAVNLRAYYCNDIFNEFNITWNNQATEVQNCGASPIFNLPTNAMNSSNKLIKIPLTNYLRNDSDKKFTIELITNPETYSETYYGFVSNSSEGTTIPKYKPFVNYTAGNATITAKSIYNSSSILSFSIRIQNGTTIRNKYTSTGTILTNINTTYAKRLVNITFYNNSNHFNQTILNYNFSAHSNTIQINATRSFTYLNVKNQYNSSQVLTLFNVTVNGLTTYLNVNKSSKIFLNDNNLNTIQIRKINYFNTTLSNKNTSANYTVYLKPYFYYFSLTYSNYTSFASKNYTRRLRYEVNLSCKNATYFTIYENTVPVELQSITCYNQTYKYNYSHVSTREGQINISVKVSSPNSNSFKGNKTFYWDIYNPRAIVGLTSSTGFSNAANITLTCIDNMISSLRYNLTYKGIRYFYGNKTNNTQQKNSTTIINGNNTVYGKCKDLFGTTSNQTSSTIYSKEILLINEKTNALLDITKITGAKVYYSNSSYYDFKSAGKNRVNFTIINTSSIRFEFTDALNQVVTRYIDLFLIPENQMRICANVNDFTIIQNTLYSGLQRPIALKNTYSDCYVAADYTRFVYQDTNILNSFTINSLYYLYLSNGSALTFLSALDGGLSGSHNVDALEFSRNGYNIQVAGDSVSVSKAGLNAVDIRYENLNEDSLSTNFKIYDMTNYTEVYNIDIPDPNYYYFVFNYSMMSITNNTLFKIYITKTTSSGQSFVKRYFTPDGSVGLLQNNIATALSVLLKIFGFTSFSVGSIFGFIGLVLIIIDLAVLSAAVGGSWYIMMLAGMDIIIAIFIIIYINKMNPRGLS